MPRSLIGWCLVLSGVLASSGCDSDPRSPSTSPSLSTSDGSAHDRPAAEAAGVDGRWAKVLTTLDGRRTRALTDLDPALLRRVYATGSDLAAQDAALIRSYARRGLELEGAALVLHRVDVVSRSGSEVRLSVVDELGAVRVRVPGGEWRTLPDDAPTERTLTLRRTETGWRIVSAQRTAG